MAPIKTKATTQSVTQYLNSIDNETRKKDAKALLKIFKEATDLKPKLWNNNMIGYGKYHYKHERSKQEGDWPLTAFAPRKTNLSIYIMPGFKNYQDLLKKLGKHKTSVGCLYINKLEDVDVKVLTQLIKKSVQDMKKMHS